MKYVLICVFLTGCSSISFNKDINSEPKEFNVSGMHWERTIQDRQFLDRRPYMKK